jgi:ribosomal protein L15
VGRNTVAKFGIRGKTLSLYLALDPAKYEDTKYIYDDVSEIKKYAGVPMRVKLRSDRSVKWTKELIADLMQNNEKEQGEIPDTVYSYPYETTEELVRKALIKVYTNGSGKEQEVTYADFDALKHERFKEITGLDILPKVTAAKAEESITDEEAKKFIHYEEVPKPQPEVEEEKQPEVKEEKPKNEHKEHKQVKPQPKKIIAQPATSNKKVKGIINIDVISINFEKDDIVTLKEMKEKGLIDKKVTYVKVLARGEIDKPLDIVADDFSLQAVKMIVMTGGSVTEIARN